MKTITIEKNTFRRYKTILDIETERLSYMTSDVKVDLGETFERVLEFIESVSIGNETGDIELEVTDKELLDFDIVNTHLQRRACKKRDNKENFLTRKLAKENPSDEKKIDMSVEYPILTQYDEETGDFELGVAHKSAYDNEADSELEVIVQISELLEGNPKKIQR